jgi:hypothetical protein
MVLAALKRRPNVSFCRHPSRSPQWARATDTIQRGADDDRHPPIALPAKLVKRILWHTSAIWGMSRFQTIRLARVRATPRCFSSCLMRAEIVDCLMES